MDCQNALDILEAARPDSDDPQAAELVSATSHVEFCPDCEERFVGRRALDREIGRAMRDVPVPAGLKERLFAALDENREAVPAPAVAITTDAPGDSIEPAVPRSEPEPVRFGRRAWLKGAAAAAVCLAVALVGWWHFRPVPKPGLSLGDLRASAPVDLSGLAQFDGAFDAQLPGGTWRFGNVDFGQPKGFLRTKHGKHRVALYSFRVRSRDGRDVNGVLLVVPRESLDDPPSRTHFSADSRPEEYARREGLGTFDTVAWSEGDLVYMCFVPVGGGGLEAIEHALSPPAV